MRIGSQSLMLLMNCAPTPSTALDGVSYLWQSTHWGHWCKRTYIVGTRLDCCNTILAPTADTVIKRLQSVQKTTASLVSGTIFRDHYHYFTQSRCVSKSTVLSLHIRTLHMTG